MSLTRGVDQLTSPDAAYQNPIKRQQGPPTGDLYAQPEKPARHQQQFTELPSTYQDPATIQHQNARATGDMYALPDKAFKRPSGPGGVDKSNQVNTCAHR